MRGAAAWLAALSACASPVLAQAATIAEQTAEAKVIAARKIADAKAEDVFAEASLGVSPRVRHIASGVTCGARPSTTITVLPAPKRGDNVGCTTPAGPGGSGLFALQVQRVPEGVDADRFLADMIQVVHKDFPDAKPTDPLPSVGATTFFRDLPARSDARFSATFQGKPVRVEVSAVRVGAWMISARLIARPEDADTLGSILELEFYNSAREALQASR
jgi:hypothetical protein